MARKKLAIVTTHPIQYNAPLFKLLTARGIIEVKIFYTWGKAALENKFDPGFGKVIDWDIPILEGYNYEFLENSSDRPGSHHFKGIINPGIIPSLKDWEPDALLIYGWNFNSHLKVMRYFKGKVPVFFRGDSTLLNDKPGFKSLLRQLALGWVYRHIDKAFYVGRHNKDYFKTAGVGEEKLVLAPHAVDNDFFEDKEEKFETEAQIWRKKLNIGEECIVFLFAGKLEQNKLPFTLLRAFQNRPFPNEAHLIFVGNGNLEAGLKEEAKQANIHFIDFQNQKLMPVVYRLGDVFILPSGSETWGLAINEAMVSGRPVICSSRCGGAVDLIREGYNGYIFAAGNQEELYNQMTLISKDRQKLKEMGRNAKADIHRFSLTRVATEIEQAIR